MHMDVNLINLTIYVDDAAFLHLDPNSPEAQVFYQFGRNPSSPHTAITSTPAPSPTTASTDIC